MIDMIGRSFGRLLVIERRGSYVSPRGKSHPVWLCRCECGTEILARGDALRNGFVTSCGCKKRGRPSCRQKE